MIEIVLIAFVILTVLLFLSAFANSKPAPPPPPPARGAVLLVEWSVNNANNVYSQGQLTFDEASLRQLPSVTVQNGNDYYTGPALATVMAQSPINYRELLFTSAPPMNPLLRAQVDRDGWIIATSRRSSATPASNPGVALRSNTGDDFRLVNGTISPPFPRLSRIFAR